MWCFISSGSSPDADIFPFFQFSVSLASAPVAGSDSPYDCYIHDISRSNRLAIPRLVPVSVVRRHFQARSLCFVPFLVSHTAQFLEYVATSFAIDQQSNDRALDREVHDCCCNRGLFE